MSSDTDGRHYASVNAVSGALQRGLGRGAHQVVSTPDTPDLVTACLRRDYRWDWQVDGRDVYLARLVRDLRMPITPITAQLRDAPPPDSDDDNVFAVALGVLGVLGRADVDEAVEGVRCYVREGDRWLDALETVAGLGRWSGGTTCRSGRVRRTSARSLAVRTRKEVGLVR